MTKGYISKFSKWENTNDEHLIDKAREEIVDKNTYSNNIHINTKGKRNEK